MRIGQFFKYTDFFKPNEISIDKCWQVVSSNFFKGKDISEVQKIEMKKAFYAGFTECFKIMNDISEVLSEDEACVVLDRINTEGHEFHDQLMKEFLKK
jgi:hypothetical protein